MKIIKLTQNQVALVDDEDYEYLSQWKWFAHYIKDTDSYYARRMEGKFPSRYMVHMSRVVVHTPDDMKCDHINHNTLDNRKQNLRNATISQNNTNARIYKNNKLGEKHIIQYYSKFRVQIYKDKKRVICETFDSLEQAKKFRDAILPKVHGEFFYTGER